MSEPHDEVWLYGVHATLNVKNCLAYLRARGIEIDDATAKSWADTEKVDRYLRRLQKTSVRTGVDMTCNKGHSWYAEKDLRRRSKKRDAANAAATTCPTCGRPATALSTRWTESLDGTLRDYRPRSERWKPRDAPHPLAPPPGVEDDDLA